MHSDNLTLKLKVIVPLYFPLALSFAVKYYGSLSYFIAWAGSFYIFYLTIFSPLSFLNTDRPLSQQLMRPIILTQLVFAGFMCCTSIFYFLNQLEIDPYNMEEIQVTAQCQRLLLLGHAAMATGIISMTERRECSKIKDFGNDRLLLNIAIVAYIISLITGSIPFISQIKYPMMNVAMSCGAYFLVQGLWKNQLGQLLFGSLISVVLMLNASLTGYKEGIITLVILIGFMAYPYFQKTITVLFIPTVCLLLYILPTFTTIIRSESWLQGKPAEQARKTAYQTFFNEEKDDQIIVNNHKFLVGRLTEIGMFRIYVTTVPQILPYYNLEIFRNALYGLLPRALWKNKPNTEKTAMKRVYECGVAERSSAVSAKTRPVVDGYLSAGAFGIFLYMLIYGICTQHICNKAEQLFNGYTFGCTIIFNSIFQPLWRGNTLEFLLNNVAYGYLLMYVIYRVIKKWNRI